MTNTKRVAAMSDEVERDEDEFSVWAFMPEGWHVPVARFVNARRAVELARRACDVIGGVASRIIITDGGDHTVFEWRRGEGIVYPPEQPG